MNTVPSLVPGLPVLTKTFARVSLGTSIPVEELRSSVVLDTNVRVRNVDVTVTSHLYSPKSSDWKSGSESRAMTLFCPAADIS